MARRRGGRKTKYFEEDDDLDDAEDAGGELSPAEIKDLKAQGLWTEKDQNWDGEVDDPEFDDPRWTPERYGWYRMTADSGEIIRRYSQTVLDREGEEPEPDGPGDDEYDDDEELDKSDEPKKKLKLKDPNRFRVMKPGGERFTVSFLTKENEWKVTDTLDGEVVMVDPSLPKAIAKAYELNKSLELTEDGLPLSFAEREQDVRRELLDLRKKSSTPTKLIISQFRSRCLVCGVPIEMGEDIWWRPGSTGWHYSHGMDTGLNRIAEQRAGRLNRIKNSNELKPPPPVTWTITSEDIQNNPELGRILGISVAGEKIVKPKITVEKEPEPLFGHKRKIRGL